MKKTKKVLAFILAMMMVVSLFTACDDEKNDKDKSVKTEESASNGKVSDGEETAEKPKAFDIARIAPEDANDEVLEIFEKVDSVHISQNVYMNLDMMGRNSEMTVNMETDVSVPDEIMHIVGTSENMGLSMTAEMYIDKNGDMATIYANANNTTWMKQDIKTDLLNAAIGNYNDTYEATKYFIKSMENVATSNVTHMGKSAVLLEGNVSFDDPEGLMANAGMSANGISTGQFVQMLTGLDEIGISVYIDSATGLPLEIKIDMADFMNSMYENMGAALNTKSMDVDVHNADYTMTFTDYNNVSVSVPDSVKNAV